MSHKLSLDQTCYRFETRETKISPYPDYAKIEQEKVNEVNAQLALARRIRDSWLSTKGDLLSEDKCFVKNIQKLIPQETSNEIKVTTSLLSEKRRDALKKLFCQDEIEYELELRALGKSSYKDY